MSKKLLHFKLRAFTLTELLVVLVIVGILVLLALPNLLPLISKAKSTEAQLQLEHIYILEKNYFYLHSRYSDNFSDISFEQSSLSTKGGNANYLIEVSQATNNIFKARATAVSDFDGDGIFNLWEIDQQKNLKEVIPD